jgi:prepilin-type N-terminal cleavage/methylation domain-containing protein
MRNRHGQGRGFTLIELTVVLMILVALAGILVPVLSGYVTRSHAAAASTNIGEINKAIQLHEVKYLGKGYGSRYDALVVGGAAYDGVEADLIGTTASGPEPLFPQALQDYQAQALRDAGILELADMQNGQLDKTFGANTGTFTAIDTAAPPTLLFLTDARARASFGLTQEQTDQEDYVVLGLGSQTTLIGHVMADAPLHFDESDPKTVYSRFLVIFAVPESDGTPAGTFKARFVGAAGAEAGGLAEHLSTYYSKDAE